MTPMMTPSSVNPERSLWLPSDRSDVANSSRTSMALGRPGGPGLHGLPLLLAHLLDLVAFLDGPERLEWTADHGLAALEAVLHLDVQLTRDPGLDRGEAHLAVRDGVDPLFGLHPARGVLVSLGGVADHDGRERNGRDVRLRAGDDVGG